MSSAHRSSRRLAAARHAGPSSRVLSASAALLAFVLVADTGVARSALAASFEPILALASGASAGSFASLARAAWQGLAGALVAILGPLLAAIVAGVLIAGVVQRAASSLGQPAREPGARPEPFDLAARVGQLLDPARAIDGLSALVAALILAAVAWLTLLPNIRGLLALPGGDVGTVVPQLIELLGTLTIRLMLAGLALGTLDYLQRRARFAARQRKTRRELLEEQREQYGDPEVRRERARLLRQRDAHGGSR